MAVPKRRHSSTRGKKRRTHWKLQKPSRSVITSYSIHYTKLYDGIATGLRAHDGSVRIVAVEPEESAVLSGRPSGSHKIEGTGAGFVVPLWEGTPADET